MRALSEYKHKLVEHKVSIYVRRGGPNYQEGLRLMADLGKESGKPLHYHLDGLTDEITEETLTEFK